MKKYRIKLNGKVYEVEMEEITGNTPVASPAAAPSVQQPAAAPAPQPQTGAGETMQAPMPGNIINIKVKVGDQVKKGQVLLILEAMKMENEIVAPVDGQIVSIGVNKGDIVNAGDVLLQIS